MRNRQLSYSEAIGEALQEEMRRDARVFLMGEGVSQREYGPALLKEFGAQRVVNMPISEAGYTGVGLGAALTGLRPVVRIGFVDLMPLTMDQLLNQVGKIRYMLGGQLTVPLVIIAPTGSTGGAAAQHSQSLDGLFIHVPGIRVAVPSTPYDAKGLLKTALREENPTVFLPSKPLNATRGTVPTDEYTVPFGKAAIRREGTDVTVVAWSRMAVRALEAATQLDEQEGISVEVVDPRTLVPLDAEALLDSVKKTGRLVIVEEECKRGAAGAEIAAMIAENGFHHLQTPLQRVAAKTVPIPYAHVMEAFVIPQVEDIVAAVRQTVHTTEGA